VRHAGDLAENVYSAMAIAWRSILEAFLQRLLAMLTAVRSTEIVAPVIVAPIIGTPVADSIF
jgi:hypothetical protein